MSVNYEAPSFSAPVGAAQHDSQTHIPSGQSAAEVRKDHPREPSKAKRQVVALLFSKRGPLPIKEWTPISAAFISTLQGELGLRRSLSVPTRFLDLDITSSLEPQTPQDPAPAAVCRVYEMTIPIPPEVAVPTLLQLSTLTLGGPLASLSVRHNVELALQPHSLYIAHQHPGLAVFDMDSTLIQQEVIDELARAVGRYDQVSAITEAAMRGEAPYIDFEASLRARVGLLKGVPTTIWEQLRRDVIKFTPGARELICVLNKLGWKTAVLSGGFTPLAEWVKSELGLDYAHANHLVEVSGCLTGELVEGKAIVHAEQKRELLTRIALQEGIDLERVIAVGDGSNDLLMMHKAGMGVAFNAKPKVQLQAPVRLNAESLLDVVHLLGYTEGEVMDVLKPEMVVEGGQVV